MTIYYKPHLKDCARKLRSQMTDAEQKLWQVIRKKQNDHEVLTNIEGVMEDLNRVIKSLPSSL